MHKLLAAALTATLMISSQTAFAGGPVVIEDEAEVVAEKPATSVGILPLVIGAIILCAVVCSGDDEEETRGIIVDGPPDQV